jgi:PAS domain S-box-containing protein
VTLREKTWISILALGTAAAISFYATSSTIVLHGFAALEERVVRDNVHQVREQIDSILGQLGTMACDWASWDDTYVFAEDGNGRYIQSVMSDESLANLRVNLIVVAQTTGRMLFGAAFDPVAKKKAPITESIKVHVSTNSLLVRRCIAGLDVRGLIRLPEGLMEIAARPILTSMATGPSRGALIMGRYLSGSEIQQISKLTRFDVAIQPMNGAALPADFEESRVELLADGDAVPVHVLAPDHVTGYALLKDIYSQPVALLRVGMPRSVHAQALATITIHAVTLLILSLIFGVVFLLFIEKVVLSRLTGLSQQVRQLGASGLAGSRLPLTGRDELTILTGELNHMLDALEQYDDDRKQMEASLRESEERFRQVAESAGEWIWEVDIDGFYTYSSPVVESILGYKPEELVGKKRFYDLFVPETQETQKAYADEVIARGESFRKFTNENVHKDGHTVVLETTGIPIRDEEGSPIGYRGTDTDITGRKKAEKTLQESRIKLLTILENIQTGVLIIDPETHTITDVNAKAARLIGKPVEEIIGSICHRNICPAEKGKCPITDLELSIDNSEHVLWAADGRSIPIHKTVVSVILEGRKVLLESFIDITERKRAEEEIHRLNEELECRVSQLVTVNKELEAFSYSVSHDLRGPLRTIDGFSQIILEDHDTRLGEPGRWYLGRVRGAAQKMSQLIDDMLMLSRLTRQELKLGKVDLSRLAAEIFAELRKTSPTRQVELVVAPGIEVHGDERLLQVVLQNLLNNAWKFTRKCERGRIEFGFDEQDGKRAFYVRDNGAGFDMRYADKLFGEFQRLHSDDEFEGTGIGLATIQRIVHRHGGKVWAEGEVGKGATFFFTI